MKNYENEACSRWGDTDAYDKDKKNCRACYCKL